MTASVSLHSADEVAGRADGRCDACDCVRAVVPVDPVAAPRAAGALAAAAKPVMEGKAVLFKKFADIDGIDLELDTTDPEKFIETVAMLAPTFGGINLEDIKAPECFIIEQQLRERMDIPVFHDDQHGTAIITAAGIINALHLTGRDLGDVKIVCNLSLIHI